MNIEKNSLVIIGASGLGKEVLLTINEYNKKSKKYEVLGFIDDDKKLEMTSIDNYGLKPSEEKIKGTGDIKITTDNFVDKFSLMLECHKETGFSNG